MGKYAFVMTNTGSCIWGVNGFINSLDFYGNTADFYLLQGGMKPDYIEQLKNTKFNFPVHVIEIDDLKKKYPNHPSPKENAWYAKFYRYQFASELQDYDAVCIVDMDMMCVNNVMDFFKFAKDSGLFLTPNNNWGYDIDNYPLEAIKGAASPPLHNMPNFCNPKKFKELLEMVVPYNLKNTCGGDMVTLFLCLHHSGNLKNVHILPNNLWLKTHTYDTQLKLQKPADKQYIYNCGDRMYMFHRRFWDDRVCAKFINDCKQKQAQELALHNIRIFWNLHEFFNTQHKLKVDFPFKFPTDLNLL